MTNEEHFRSLEPGTIFAINDTDHWTYVKIVQGDDHLMLHIHGHVAYPEEYMVLSADSTIYVIGENLWDCLNRYRDFCEE